MDQKMSPKLCTCDRPLEAKEINGVVVWLCRRCDLMEE